MSIAVTSKIIGKVSLGKNIVVEDFCIIGCRPAGPDAEEIETVIGDNAVIRSHTVIYAGSIIGSNFQTGHKANIREFNRIGDNVSIGTLSVVEHHVLIEDGVRIHSQAFIPEYSTLGESSWVGPNVVFTNAAYPRSDNVSKELKGPTLKAGAKIGANATLLPGVCIGRNALVGAGAVVTKDVMDEEVVVGNPARTVKTIRELPYGEDSIC